MELLSASTSSSSRSASSRSANARHMESREDPALAGAERRAQPAADDAGPARLPPLPSRRLASSASWWVSCRAPVRPSPSFIPTAREGVSKRRDQFGTGVIRGRAAPEGANNSETRRRARAAPYLGIPGSGTNGDPPRGARLWAQARAALHRREPGMFWAWWRACTSAT